jgi:lysophospholipase L1-like esterase
MIYAIKSESLKNCRILMLVLVLSQLIQGNSNRLKSRKIQRNIMHGNGFQPDSQRNNLPRSFLALGDSYTIGESVPLAENYPSQTAALLNKEGMNFLIPRIIARTGWTTANLLDALHAESGLQTHYYIVTLLIGVNNQYQGGAAADYKTDFQALLEKSISYAEKKPSHVIVLSIPDYSGTPFVINRSDRDFIANQIDSFNLINRGIAERYGVHYLNITDESRKAFTDRSLLARDGLHYSAKEYAIWSALLVHLITKLVN